MILHSKKSLAHYRCPHPIPGKKPLFHLYQFPVQCLGAHPHGSPLVLQLQMPGGKGITPLPQEGSPRALLWGTRAGSSFLKKKHVQDWGRQGRDS